MSYKTEVKLSCPSKAAPAERINIRVNVKKLVGWGEAVLPMTVRVAWSAWPPTQPMTGQIFDGVVCDKDLTLTGGGAGSMQAEQSFSCSFKMPLGFSVKIQATVFLDSGMDNWDITVVDLAEELPPTPIECTSDEPDHCIGDDWYSCVDGSWQLVRRSDSRCIVQPPFECVEGEWDCDGTTKVVCHNNRLSYERNSPDCGGSGGGGGNGNGGNGGNGDPPDDDDLLQNIMKYTAIGAIAFAALMAILPKKKGKS